MKLFAKLFGKKQNEELKTLAEYKRITLIEQTKEQFQKLIEKKIGISSVALSQGL